MHSHLSGHPCLHHAVRKLERMGPDQFELFFRRKNALRIETQDGNTESLSQSEDVGLAIRIIKDQRLGFSFTTRLDENSVERTAEAALEIAQTMPEDPHHGFHTLSSSVYPAVDTLDSRGLRAPIQEKTDLYRSLVAATREADSRVRGIQNAQFSEIHTETHIIDSSGDSVSHASTLYTASISCKAEQAGDAQMGHDFGFANELDSLNVQAVGKQAASYATELLNAASAPTRKCPAILRNSVVARLIEFLSSSFSAKEIDQGGSLLAGQHGELFFSEAITLLNDGLMAGGFATAPFDGEGVPSRLTTLVDGGFISGALYDIYYARKLDQEPTGSSVRGIQHPPSIGPTNLYLKPGRRSLLDLCARIPNGILITHLMGIQTINPMTGDFSLGASGILIEKGKLTRPVRGFAVAGNILELFKRMTELGNDMRFFGATGAPSAWVTELSIEGT